MKPPIPIRRYMLLQFGLVAILPVIIIALLAWLFLMPQMRADIRMEHQALVRAIAGQIAAHMMGAERRLVALANYLADGGAAAGQVALLDAQCGDGELFEAIYRVSDRDNAIQSIGLARMHRARREELLGLSMTDRRFVAEARRTKAPVWSATFPATASGRMAVAVAVPLPGGLVVGEIPLNQLTPFVRHIPLGAGLFTLVLDQEGRILADSQEAVREERLTLDRLPSAAAAAGPGRAPAEERFELKGRRMVGTVTEIDRLGWTILLAQPWEEAHAPLKATLIMVAAGLAAALGLALLLAWVRSGYLSRLAGLYAGHSQAIAQGDYDLKWPRFKTAEFAHLSRNLQQMAGRIRRREEELLDSQARMRITMDAIGDALIVTDAGGAVTRMNPVAEKLTGWPSAEAVGRPLAEVFPIVNAHTRQPVPDPVEKVLAEGKTVGLANDTLLIARDGREYQIADSAAPIRQEDGPIVGVVLVFRDVTERYLQEQKIRASERLLKDITANVPGVVYQFRSDRDHVYTTSFVSEKAAEIFGLDPDPATFLREFNAHIPADEQKRFRHSVREAVDHLQPWQYEGRFIKPGGEEIWFAGNSIPRRSGDTVVFYGVLMDITRRRQMEASLRLTQLCFDKASFGIFQVGGDGQILNVNEKACQSLGYSREELCRLTIFDIDPNFSPDMWSAHNARLRPSGSRTIETLHRRKDGTVFPVEILINVMRFEDQEIRVSFVQDISERKRAQQITRRLEEALSHSQKMEAIGTLAGGIAHDFNNTLAAVMGFAELSLPMAPAGSPLHQNLREIMTAGLRARDLVKQILTFSRKDERELLPLQVAPLVKESVRLLRSTLPSSIEISQHIDGELAYVMADPTQIHQIVMNLCTNAAHAMEADGGRMGVSLAQVRLSVNDIRLLPGLVPGDYLKLSVQDTGCGIPPEIIEKIYDPYFTTKGKGKGTGLGLAVVHGIVKNYGGAVDVHSEPGIGSTFDVYIPTATRQAKAEAEAAPDLPGGSEHILLVDDEPALVEVERQMLEQWGYRVTTAVDSREALHRFRQSPRSFDLVLTDMTMPHLSGARLAGELLQIRPDLPVILATGYSLEMSAEKALEMGIRAFVQKPVVAADLAVLIRKVLDEARSGAAG